MRENISYGKRRTSHSFRHTQGMQRGYTSQKHKHRTETSVGTTNPVRSYLLTKIRKRKTPELKAISKQAFNDMRKSLLLFLLKNKISQSAPPKILSPKFLEYTENLFCDYFGMFSRPYLVYENNQLFLEADIALTLGKDSFPTLRLGGLEKLTGNIREAAEAAVGELLHHNRLLTSAHETVWSALFESIQEDDFKAYSEDGQEFIDANIDNIKSALEEINAIPVLIGRLRTMQRTPREKLEQMLEECQENGENKEKNLANYLLKNIDLLYKEVWEDRGEYDYYGSCSVSISAYDYFPVTLYEMNLTELGYATAMAVFEWDVECLPIYTHKRVNHDGFLIDMEPDKNRFIIFIEELSSLLEKF